MTAKENYEQMEQVKERLLELLHYQKKPLAYRKGTEIAVEIVRQIESENQFPGLTKESYHFYTLTREALHNLLVLCQSLLKQGKSTHQILEVMMPS